jgi:hypothetical protein
MIHKKSYTKKKKQCYPKMIFKGDERMVVNTPYEHAAKVAEGWSGPPEYESDLADLEKEIEKTELELAGMKKRLEDMKESLGIKEGEKEEPVPIKKPELLKPTNVIKGK